MPIILGLIPARGGSKGIVDKNIKPLNGIPLIDYTINSAKNSVVLSDIIVSTDSQKIVEHAERLGITVPELRPEHLSSDTAKSIDVVIYEILNYEKTKSVTVDAVVLLQPTAPLRTAQDIDNAVELYNANNAHSLISCYNAENVHPRVMYRRQNNTLIPYEEEGKIIQRRQDMEQVYIRNGAIYITSREQIMDNKNMICDAPLLYEMHRDNSVNIDSLTDLHYAEYLLKQTETQGK